MPTIAQVITEGASQLKASGIDNDRRDASLLLGHTLGVDRTHLLVNSDQHVSEAAYGSYLQLIERRAAGEPLQYVTGHQEFYGLDFIVTPAVLIPRPETELLVESAIKRLEASPDDTRTVVDVGTGSGCVAVAIAAHVAGARVIGIDCSQAALAVAALNAKRHGMADRIPFIEGDLLAALQPRDLEGKVDLIVSNPPYVTAADLEQLQREVRDYEPRIALFGGEDGLDFYRRLLSEATRFLKSGGKLVIEIGVGQLAPICEIIPDGLELIDSKQDLQGIPRILTMGARM